MSDIGKSKKSLRRQKKRQELENQIEKEIKKQNEHNKNQKKKEKEMDDLRKMRASLNEIYSKMEFLGKYYKNIRTDTGKKEEERGTIYNYLSMVFFNNGLGFQYYGINNIFNIIKNNRLNTDKCLENIKKNIGININEVKNNIQKVENNIQEVENNIQEIERILNIEEINNKIGTFINEKNIKYTKHEIEKIKNNISDIKSFIQNTKKIDIDKVIKKISNQFKRIETNFYITVHHLFGSRNLNSPESTITFADNIHKKLHNRATSFMQDLDNFDNKTNLKKLKNDIEMIYKDIENSKKRNVEEINKINQILSGNTEEIENLKNKIKDLDIKIGENVISEEKLNKNLNIIKYKFNQLDIEIKKIDKEVKEFYNNISINNEIIKKLHNNLIIQKSYEEKIKEDYKKIDLLNNKANEIFVEKVKIYKIKFEEENKLKELEKENKKKSELKKKLENKLNEYNIILNDKNLGKKSNINKKIEELDKDNKNLEEIFNTYNGIYNTLKNVNINNFSNTDYNNIKNELEKCKKYKDNKKIKNKYKNIFNEFNKDTDRFINNCFSDNFIKSFGNFKNKINKLINIEERMITEIENNQIKVLEGINSLKDDELLEKTMESIYNFKAKSQKKFKDTLKEKEKKDKYKCEFQEENGIKNIEFGDNQKLKSLYEKIKNNNFSEEDYIINANDSKELEEKTSQLKKSIYIAKIFEKRDKTLKTNVADFIRSENQKIIDGNNKYIAEAKERVNSLKDISKCIDNIEQIKSNRQRF